MKNVSVAMMLTFFYADIFYAETSFSGWSLIQQKLSW